MGKDAPPGSVTKNRKQLCPGKMGLFLIIGAGGPCLPGTDRSPECVVTSDAGSFKWEPCLPDPPTPESYLIACTHFLVP